MSDTAPTISSGPPDDALSSPPGDDAPATPRDTQRTALADLVGLLQRSAAAEAQIARAHAAAVQAADRELDRARLQADHVLSSTEQEQARQYTDRSGEIERLFDTDAANAAETDRLKRLRVEAEHDGSTRDARKALEHTLWLADSVADGTQAKVKTDLRRAREEHDNQLQAIDELRQRADATIERYGYRLSVPPAAEASAPPIDGPMPPAEVHKLQLGQAEQWLGQLSALALPKVMVGITPWALGLVFSAAAGAAGKLLLGGRLPDWQAIAAGGTVGAALAIVTGLVLNVTARRQVRGAFAPLVEALSAASVAADRHLAETRTRLEQLAQRALQQREVEIRAARDKADPLLARAKSKRDDAVAALDREIASRQAHLAQRREKARSDLEQSRHAATRDLRARVEADLAAAAARHAERRRQLDAQHAADRQRLAEQWQRGMEAIGRSIGRPEAERDNLLLDWSDESIARWTPPRSFPSAVRFGRLEVDPGQLLARLPQETPFTLELPRRFELPAVLSLPRQANLLIQADRAGRPAAVATLQMMMARLLTSIPPGRVKFTIVDPVALGQNFAGFMHLADYDETLVTSRIWTDAEHIELRLADLTEHMETVIQKYLRNEFETIDDYNRQAGELAEPYRFLVLCDYPHGFSPEATRRLASIASTGARCGVYTLVFRDTRQPLPAGSGFDDVEAHSVSLVQQTPSGDRFAWTDEVFAQFPLVLDGPPGEEQLTRLMHAVGRLAREANRVEVPFETIAPRAEPDFWSLSARNELRVPIGRMGATRQQALRLGRGVAQHALVAGKTGSGKSTLLHAIITNAAMWYAPGEVELYLIDFKKGVEFKTYATHALAHARAIAVESDREFGLSVLQRIDAEMTRRGEMFRKAGVQDLAGYRDATNGDGATERQGEEGKDPDLGRAAVDSARRAVVPALPRILLIIDEFQEFFTEDDKLAQDAAMLLDRLVRQGRAFGIHVLLGSQTIGGAGGGLSRATLGQMAVRIALQTTEADSQLILGDNNSAARLLSRPGEAIYNDAGGLVEGNSPFQVAWLPDEQRDRFLDDVNRRVRESGLDGRLTPPIVFEGNAPADIRKNARLLRMLTGQDLSTVPLAYLGDPVAIKDPTAIAFRRQAGTNALMVGQNEEAAMAMTMAAMLSLSASLPPGRARFVLLDGTPADSPLHGRLPGLGARLRHELRAVEYRSAGEAVAELAGELKRRQESDDASAEQVFVVVFGLQRYRALRKSDEGFSFSMSDPDRPPAPDKLFAELLREGPALGIHVFAWADTAVSVDRTIERNSLREFDHRILMQMSAADSSSLIDSPAANKLGFHRAIAYSEEQGVIEKFRPYALPPDDLACTRAG